MVMVNGLTGFARKIETATSFLAELWALQDGLLLCLQVHAQAVFIELDAKAIVDAFVYSDLPAS